MKNRILYIISAVLLIILLIVIVFMATKPKNNTPAADPLPLRGKESDVAQIEPTDLPSKKELEALRLEDVIQTDKINDQFALASYQVDGISMVYYFQADAVTNGERLTVTARTMDPAEYQITLPAGDKVQKTNIGEYEMTFYDRMIYYVADENVEIPSVIQDNLQNGHAEIRYRSGMPELLNCQSMQWYDNGIAYNMESINRSYTLEDMSRLVSDYLNNRK